MPGWITQADLLQVIGPSVAARSDTLSIRAYGEAVDPATGKTTAKAWCEAMVQRMPGHLDAADPPEVRGRPTERKQPALRPELSYHFFRWLAEDEI